MAFHAVYCLRGAFPKMSSQGLRSIVGVAVVAMAAACGAAGITDSLSSSDVRAERSDIGVNLIECPSSQSATATGLVTPLLGGVVSVGGMVVTVPAGAVLAPTTIEVTVPASQYLEIDVSVPGVEHFQFEVPIVVSMSYARCNRADILRTPLTAWYIDSSTKEPLDQMISVDNKLLRHVTFTTIHFSGYALAN
jgi:hypothetical protein